VVFFPFAIALYLIWVLVWASVFTLPLIAVFSLVLGYWLYAAELSVLWAALFFLSRWKKLHVDSKDTLDWKNGNI
jgi:hypothetical protein